MVIIWFDLIVLNVQTIAIYQNIYRYDRFHENKYNSFLSYNSKKEMIIKILKSMIFIINETVDFLFNPQMYFRTISRAFKKLWINIINFGTVLEIKAWPYLNFPIISIFRWGLIDTWEWYLQNFPHP